MVDRRQQGLTVVGATAVPTSEELPQFLDPICADLSNEGPYFVAHVSPWDNSQPLLQPISRERFEEECEAGYWQRLPQEFPFRWDCRLVALEEGEPAQYLPAGEAYERARGLGIRALHKAEEIFERTGGDDTARDLIWSATRAIPEDAFPLLVAIAVDRRRLSDKVLKDLILELPEPTQHSALLDQARKGEWPTLFQIVAQDSLGPEYLSPRSRTETEAFTLRRDLFLEDLPDYPNFLHAFQMSYGAVTAIAA